MDSSDVFQTSWNKLIRVGVIWINVNQVRIFFIPIQNQVGVVPIYRIFAPNFSNIEIIFVLGFFFNLLSLRFSTWFQVSFLVVPLHGKTSLTKSNTSQLFDILDSVIVLTMDLCVFILVRLLIFLADLGKLIPLFKLPMGGNITVIVYQSGCLIDVDNSWLNSEVRPI